MKFITQGETPLVNVNEVEDIVETDAKGNELATLPTSTKPLPIIWLTNKISTETIAAMMAAEKYIVRIYTDIEKDAVDVPGYQKPLFLIDEVFLSLPSADPRAIINVDDPNDIEIPVSFIEARELCQDIFNHTPLKESKEYDLFYDSLRIQSEPYNPSSPSPSPVLTPAPILNIPVPPPKGKAKAIEAKKPTPPSSPKREFGDLCPKCRRPYKYDHVAWAQGKTDGYTCRCKKNDDLLPSLPPTALTPRPLST
jgi:hypothetical protein